MESVGISAGKDEKVVEGLEERKVDPGSIPEPLRIALQVIDSKLPEKVKVALKEDYPNVSDVDPFFENPFPPLEGYLAEVYPEDGNLCVRIQRMIDRELVLGWGGMCLPRQAKYPELQKFFRPYMISDGSLQAFLLLDFYVSSLRGHTIEWEKLLDQNRLGTIRLIEDGWASTLKDVLSMDQKHARPLLEDLEISLKDAMKTLEEKSQKSE